MTFGGYSGTGASYMLGGISTFRFYNRVLSATEVLKNYQSTFPRIFGNIAVGGPVLYLDAGNKTSYPTTGTTWYDLSGYGNNATLVNGPAFSNPLSIVFDGVNDYCSTTLVKTFTSMTIQVWFYGDGDQFGTYGYAGLVANRTSPADATGLLLNNGNNKSLGYSWNGVTNTWSWNSGLVLTYYGWHFLSLTVTPTLATAFLNGATATNAVSHSPASITSLAIGKDYLTERFITGGIGSVYIYDRALSNDEVLQNYNATLGRYASASTVVRFSIYDACYVYPYYVYAASGSLTVGNTVYYNGSLTSPFANKSFSETPWPDLPVYSNIGVITDGSGVITAIKQSLGGCYTSYC